MFLQSFGRVVIIAVEKSDKLADGVIDAHGSGRCNATGRGSRQKVDSAIVFEFLNLLLVLNGAIIKDDEFPVLE
jgi:hypothetical protein